MLELFVWCDRRQDWVRALRANLGTVRRFASRLRARGRLVAVRVEGGDLYALPRRAPESI